MTENAISETKDLVKGWYERHPEIFDQVDNKELFKFYLTRFLGLPLNPVAEMRLEKYAWSTIERTFRLLVSENTIKMSEGNKEARHVEAEKTKEITKGEKKKVDYSSMYVFTTDGRAVLKQ